MTPTPSKITKTYPPRGPLQQVRIEEAAAFSCMRCGQEKRSKLMAIYGGDWNRRLCNGCYGRLLSIYEVKAGTAPEDERADQLAAMLAGILSSDQQREAERLLSLSDNRASVLTPEAFRFLATADHVANGLRGQPSLEWSPAVIGLCKAVEIELISRIVEPLAAQTQQTNLVADIADKDISRVASFCANPKRKPPELGTIAHFLQTAANSQSRREGSELLKAFLKLCAGWPGSNWILDPKGLCVCLSSLTRDYRNPAAHVEELTEQRYSQCRNMLIGSDGALWRLCLSVSR